MKRTPIAIGVVAIVAWWLATTTSPVVVAAVVTILAVVAARRRRRWRQVQRHAVAPTVAVLRRSVGVPLRVKMTPAFAALVPLPARRLPTPQLRIGDRIWRHLPHIAWPARPPRLAITFATGYLSKAAREHVNAVIASKLSVDGLTQSWDQRGHTVTAVWTPRARPPARVSAGTLAAGIPARDSTFLLGLGAGNRPVTVDLDTDSPHVALSGGSGSGKSVLASVIAVQVLARGGRVVVCDVKTNSHTWAAGMSTVIYASHVARIHQVLITAATIAARRNARGSARYPILVVIEEANSMIARLRSHWDTVRGKSDPKASPAVAALAELAHQGRSARVHLLVAAQQAAVRAFGGDGAVRESFGARLLARATPGTWRMLAGPGVPMPAGSRHPGRWHLVLGDQVAEVQVPHLTPAGARRMLGVPGVPGLPTPATPRDVSWDKGRTEDKPPVLSLAEAVDSGTVPWSLPAVRKRLQRSANPPQPVDRRGAQTNLYERDDLVAWVEQETTRT